MDVNKLLEFLIAVGIGGFGTKLLDHSLNKKKYDADVDKTTSEQWKVLYSELRQIVMEQRVELDKLRLTCDKLTLENIKLTQQFDFVVAINKEQ